MKKRFIPLIAVGGLFAAVIVFAGSDVLFNTCHYKVDKDGNNSSWMSNIKDEAKLTDIVIPGAHDAGTEGMIWLGETQHKEIKYQLKDGFRYFDIRVRKTDKDEHIIYHDIINGNKFESIFNDIVSFIKSNKTETLLLDFQHFDGGDPFVITLLERNKDLLVKNDTSLSDLEFIDSLTLGQVRGKMIAFFGDNKANGLNKNYIFDRNNDSCSREGSCLDSYYDDDYKKSSKYLIDNVLPENYNRIERKIVKEGHKGIFVLQGQLTDGKLIFGPYSKERGHRKNMSKYIDGIKDDSRRLSLTNVIMRDFVNEDIANEIIKLNEYKGLVK